MRTLVQGGAVDSYTDPTDSKSYNYGVAVFVDYGNSTKFFERFNTSLSALVPPTMTTLYADFGIGEELANYTAPAWDDVVVALEKYLKVSEKYEDSKYALILSYPTSLPR